MKKDASTQDKINHVGKKLFSAHGYLGTSMADIAKEVGITKASLYYFYKNKQDLFLTVVSDVYSDIETLLITRERKKRGRQDLNVLVKALIEVLQPHGALLDAIDSSHFDTDDPAFRKVLERELALDALMQTYLKSCGVKQTQLASHTLFTATQGYLLRLKYGVDDISPSRFANFMATILTK